MGEAATGIRISICRKHRKSGKRRKGRVTDGEKPSDERDPEGVAGRQSSPYTGKPSARPAGEPGALFIHKENLGRTRPLPLTLFRNWNGPYAPPRTRLS